MAERFDAAHFATELVVRSLDRRAYRYLPRG